MKQVQTQKSQASKSDNNLAVLETAKASIKASSKKPASVTASKETASLQAKLVNRKASKSDALLSQTERGTIEMLALSEVSSYNVNKAIRLEFISYLHDVQDYEHFRAIGAYYRSVVACTASDEVSTHAVYNRWDYIVKLAINTPMANGEMWKQPAKVQNSELSEEEEESNGNRKKSILLDFSVEAAEKMVLDLMKSNTAAVFLTLFTQEGEPKKGVRDNLKKIIEFKDDTK